MNYTWIIVVMNCEAKVSNETPPTQNKFKKCQNGPVEAVIVE